MLAQRKHNAWDRNPYPSRKYSRAIRPKRRLPPEWEIEDASKLVTALVKDEEWQSAPTLQSLPPVQDQTCELHIASELEENFRTLAAQWRKETRHFSLVKKAVAHRAYKKILTLGKGAIPLILRELQERPDHWFDALELLADENPVLPEHDFDQAVRAWLDWGREKGFIG